MPIRRLYRQVTSVYRRAGMVARHALREVRATPDRVAPTADLARLGEQGRMLDALRGLPEPYRSALVHCHIDGLAPEAVARRLGVPAEVVRTRLRHALRLLRERLGQGREGGVP